MNDNQAVLPRKRIPKKMMQKQLSELLERRATVTAEVQAARLAKAKAKSGKSEVSDEANTDDELEVLGHQRTADFENEVQARIQEVTEAAAAEAAKAALAMEAEADARAQEEEDAQAQARFNADVEAKLEYELSVQREVERRLEANAGATSRGTASSPTRRRGSSKRRAVGEDSSGAPSSSASRLQEHEDPSDTVSIQGELRSMMTGFVRRVEKLSEQRDQSRTNRWMATYLLQDQVAFSEALLAAAAGIVVC